MKKLPPLTDDQRRVWTDRLDRAYAHHAKYWELADTLRQEYLGRKDPRFTYQDTTHGKPINLIASFINTTLPRLLPATPWQIVTPAMPGEEVEAAAPVVQARMQQVWERPDTFEQVRRALVDSYFLAGYILDTWQPAGSRKAKPRGTDGGTQPPPEFADPTAGYRLDVDEPVPMHVGYRNVLIDPDTRDYNRPGWLCYVTEMRLEDIRAADEKAGGLFHNTGDVQSGSAKPDADEKKSDETPTPAKPDQRAKVYTILCPGPGRGVYGVLILAGSTRVEIRHDLVDFGTRGFPLRRLQWYDVGDLFPADPLQFWIDLHTSVNEFAAEATARAKQAKRITLVPDQKTAEILHSATAGDILTSIDPARVKQLELGGTTPDTWNTLAAYLGWVDKISGMSDTQRGVYGTEGQSETATKTMQIAQAVAGRIDAQAGETTRFLKRISEDMAALLFTHQWQDVPVAIDEAAGRRRFETFSNRSVPASLDAYQFDVDLTNTMRVSPAVRQKRAQDLLKLLADGNLQQLAAAEGKRFSVIAALEEFLDALGVRDVQRFVQDLPDLRQQQAQAAEEENAMMQQTGQPAPVNGVGDDHQVHVLVHMQAADDPAVAEHLAEHYGMMSVGQGQAQPGMQLPAGQAPATPPGIAPGGEAALAGQAQGVA